MATGKELKNAIKGKGLTFEAAARRLGISRQTLHTHMSKARIDTGLIKNVKEKLDILLTDTPDENWEGNNISELIKVISQQSATILNHAETINSQQHTIHLYAVREAPDITEDPKNVSPSSKTRATKSAK